MGLKRQTAFALMRVCGIPRFNHHLRCHHPVASSDAAELADSLVASTLINLLQLNSQGREMVFSNTLLTLDLTRTISFVDLAPLAYQASVEGIVSPATATS